MKQTRLWLTTIVVLLCSLATSAHDFEVSGIYYNITSSTDQKVAVTYRGSSYNSYSNEYSGAVIIPSTVTYNSETYSVTSIGNSAFYDCSSLTSITIPEGVTSIGDYAFDNCTSLKEVTFEDGSTTLSLGYQLSSGRAVQGLFYDCPLEMVYLGRSLSYADGSSSYSPFNASLKNLIITGSVTSIPSYLFYYCTNLTSITIPKSVSWIGVHAFYGCNLTSIVVETGNTNYYSHNNCNAIIETNSNTLIRGCDSTVIPEGVTSIFAAAFRGSSGLTSITIPESVTSIGNYAFDNCTSLKEVIFEDGSETLSLGYSYYYSSSTGQGLFYDCPLESVYLGRNLSYSSGSSYGYSPFCNKDVLVHVTIGREVTAVANYAFYGCDNIHSLTINSGVLSIGSSAFSTPRKVIWLTNTPPTGYANAKGKINYVANNQYTSLSNVKVYPYLSSMFEVDGVKYVPVSPSERTCHAIDCTYDSTAEIINVSETTSFKGVAMKVTEVMPYTFYGNNHIKEIAMSHLGNIGNYAFYNCDSIKTVNVSNQGNIGSQAFCYCDAIESVTISNQGDIGEQAFYDCNGIRTIEVNNRGSIGAQAFYGCNGMATAIIDNVGKVNSEVFSSCSSLQTVTLGDSIGSLGNKAFYQCTSLQEIVVPNSVKAVGEYCLSGCSAMKSATIGDGVSNIAAYTFQGCKRLKNVAVGDSVTIISNYAFQNCSSLPEISIPQATTTIGDYAFSGCTQLADVIIEDRTTALSLGSNGSSALFADCPLDSVYIGGKITYNTTSSKGYSPFYRNTSLRSVVITDREEQIYDNEFYGCTNLQNVTIGNGVKSIGNYAFSGCSSLAGFSFGSSMETIGNEAFSDCTNLTSITSHAAVPPTCGTQALDDINKWNCVLGVPLGNADAYYAADQWKEFFFIEDVVEVDHYVLTYMVDGEVYHTEVLKYKDEVTMLAEPTKVGYEFSGWDKTLTTMPAEDVNISGTFTRLPVDNLVILDTEENFLIDEEMECDTVTYTRHFNDTQWQALYVPFEIPVTEEFLANFEVADLNNVHQYDHNDDGETDETVIEAFKVTSGTLEANYPYLIRAKETGEKSIIVTADMLYATEENSIDCSSVRERFTFTGTYSRMTSDALIPGEGYYTLIDGEWQPATEETTLGAFRFYLKVDSRNSNTATVAQSIKMRIVGENGSDDDATGMEKSEIRNQK